MLVDNNNELVSRPTIALKTSANEAFGGFGLGVGRTLLFFDGVEPPVRLQEERIQKIRPKAGGKGTLGTLGLANRED